MTLFIAPRPGDVIEDDARLLELAMLLAGDARPRRRILSVTWLDDADRLTGVLVPIQGVHALPDGHAPTNLGGLLALLDEHAPGGSAVAVLARPGGSAITATDRAWNTMLREQGRERGVRVRGFFVAAGGAVRPLTLDDAR